MKKSTLFDSLKTSKFRHGGYASLLIIAAIAIVIAVNLVVEQIPWKADLTQNQLYSLSDETKKALAGLKSDVTITTLAKVDQEDSVIKEVLAKYALLSGHVKLQTIDPERNPVWSKQYDPAAKGLQEGTLVVVGPKRFKTIGRYDMYNIDFSNPNQQPQFTSLSAEQRLTAALQYVTVEKNPILYALQGHGEDSVGTLQLQTPLENENYEMKDLSLLSAQSVPADAEMLLVLSPKVDLSAAEADKIRAYLAGGGRVMFILNLPQKTAAFANLEGLLESYGVTVERLLVVEGDANRVAGNNPMFLLPKLETHAILTPLNSADLPVLIPFAQAIKTLDLKKKSITVEPLLSSSLNSWGKVNYMNLTTLTKQKGDVEGPFTLAAAITDQSSDPSRRNARLVVVGTAGFLRQDFATAVPGNIDFFLNSLSWLREKKDTISIQPKSLMTFHLRINELQSLALSGVVVILMPLIVLGLGFTIWMRRRHL